MTTCGAFASNPLDFIASPILTKSPAEFVTTADRMALAPLGTPTKVGASLNSEGISQTVVERSSLLLLDMHRFKLGAVTEPGMKASVSGYHTTLARVATESSTLISSQTISWCYSLLIL